MLIVYIYIYIFWDFSNFLVYVIILFFVGWSSYVYNIYIVLFFHTIYILFWLLYINIFPVHSRGSTFLKYIVHFHHYQTYVCMCVCFSKKKKDTWILILLYTAKRNFNFPLFLLFLKSIMSNANHSNVTISEKSESPW